MYKCKDKNYFYYTLDLRMKTNKTVNPEPLIYLLIFYLNPSKVSIIGDNFPQKVPSIPTNNRNPSAIKKKKKKVVVFSCILLRKKERWRKQGVVCQQKQLNGIVKGNLEKECLQVKWCKLKTPKIPGHSLLIEYGKDVKSLFN